MHIHSQIVSPSEANLKGCNVVLTFESVHEKSQYSVPMQVKVLAVLLYGADCYDVKDGVLSLWIKSKVSTFK